MSQGDEFKFQRSATTNPEREQGTEGGQKREHADDGMTAAPETLHLLGFWSFEQGQLCHDTGVNRFLVDLRPGRNESLRNDLREPRLERYIGVVYRPDTERMSHYSRASLPEQYDGFVWFDETRAVTPIPTQIRSGEDETYPFGL